jgi:hypothetical protein
MNQPNVTQINVERTVAKLIVAKYNADNEGRCDVDADTLNEAIALLKLQEVIDTNPLDLTPIEGRIYRTLSLAIEHDIDYATLMNAAGIMTHESRGFTSAGYGQSLSAPLSGFALSVNTATDWLPRRGKNMPAATNAAFDLQSEVDLILNSIRDGLNNCPQTRHDTMLFVLMDKDGTIERHAIVLKHHDRPDLLLRIIKKLGKQFAARHHGADVLGVALIAEANMTDPTDATRETDVIMVEALSGTLTPAWAVLSTVRNAAGYLSPGGWYKANVPPVAEHLKDFINIYRRCQPKAGARWN